MTRRSRAAEPPAILYPPVIARPAMPTEGGSGSWLVEQAGRLIAACPVELQARIIAVALDSWFQREDQK